MKARESSSSRRTLTRDIAQTLGCDGYITKPFDIDCFVGIIARELPAR